MKRQLVSIVFVIAGTILVFTCLFNICGCMQVIVEKPDGTKYKLNTFLYKLDIEKLATDKMVIEKYKGDPGETDIYTPWGAIKNK